jgi:hypothetical protein
MQKHACMTPLFLTRGLCSNYNLRSEVVEQLYNHSYFRKGQ